VSLTTQWGHPQNTNNHISIFITCVNIRHAISYNVLRFTLWSISNSLSKSQYFLPQSQHIDFNTSISTFYFNMSISILHIRLNVFQCFSISKISALQRTQHHNLNFSEGTIITLYLNHIDSSTTMIIHIISCWRFSQR